jgi:hypothetical protein
MMHGLANVKSVRLFKTVLGVQDDSIEEGRVLLYGTFTLEFFNVKMTSKYTF